jgi:hypothetical protein
LLEKVPALTGSKDERRPNGPKEGFVWRIYIMGAARIGNPDLAAHTAPINSQ